MNGARPIRKAAVLGAGVMGAQIAAHLANAEIQVLLFELPDPEGNDPNAPARRAVEQLEKLDPQPLASPSRLGLIKPVNYQQHLEELRDCQLVIEAIAERLDLKTGLFSRIAPFVGEQALLTSNTSGLSIAELSRALPEGLRSRFCGMHFFNPPRYMQLVELIAAPQTHRRVLDRLETFLVSRLGKGVVRAKDTPNFIANRVGVFSLTATLIHAQRLGLNPETVDALTGPLIQRPKSATYRTADVVGLDTLAHVVEGAREWLKDDPWRDCLILPDWLRGLVERGALGQKRGEGVYRKKGKEIAVWDPAQDCYRPVESQVDKDV
ncbi:MAG: 3-hydroxyacyl-CoA dehydrogenase family protein, partial [Candidatus Competibacteraceae bacterium]|nr:3-hydroxyacyl-CoA dehydrogenase family protein [Candidatus Competibacteraceae bacterium]